MKKKVIATSTERLQRLIEKEMKISGPNCDLNFIDVSCITDMSYLFARSHFNGDISKWDTRSVEDMEGMFYCSLFNGDISGWNVEKLVRMNAMFTESDFTGDLCEWKPYSLLWDASDAFSHSHAIAPYWAKYDDVESRNAAIDSYQSKKELTIRLTSDLDKSDSSHKKNKI